MSRSGREVLESFEWVLIGEVLMASGKIWKLEKSMACGPFQALCLLDRVLIGTVAYLCAGGEYA
jgi:hypothetical protein